MSYVHPDYENGRIHFSISTLGAIEDPAYGAIAKYLGAARSARMVGWAMNNAHSIHPSVPAHRVVNRIGVLSGKAHFAHPNEMQEKLESEGIVVKNDQVQDFIGRFWDPMKELEI